MIIIDSDNYAEHGIETMFFPGGEPHVKIPRFKEMPVLFLKLRTWNDTGFAALLCNAIHHQFKKFPRVFIPYFPAARQDKTDGTAPRSIDITGMLFVDARVTAFDLHSAAAANLLGVFARSILMPANLIGMSIKDDVVGIIAPDSGAYNRAQQFRNKFYPTAYILQCSKHRDPKSGKLSHYYMPELQRTGRHIIVDDICDGGGTFNLLAEAWKKQPGRTEHSKLELFVSHGIFSKGLDAIDPVIEHITTTDSWCETYFSHFLGKPNPRLTILPLLPSYLKFIGTTA